MIFLDHLSEDRQEGFTVLVRPEDLRAAIATRGDVIKRSGIFKTKGRAMRRSAAEKKC